MSPVTSIAGNSPAVLHDIDWQTYTRLLRAFAGHRRLRLTYDRGTLEIMNPFWEHERQADLLGCFIVVLTEELKLPRLAGRTVTLRRQKKRRGLEPDHCYWIASAVRLQGKTRLDLRTDPPPDLAIEIDLTRSSINRMDIYAALAVPEVWRLSNGALEFHQLESGHYEVRPYSQSFPKLAASDLLAFLAKVGELDDAALVLQFREWVRRVLVTRPGDAC